MEIITEGRDGKNGETDGGRRGAEEKVWRELLC